MGRTGRVLILVAVVVGIVLALLIATSQTAGAADGADEAAIQAGPSTARPWFGGRVEMRKAGFAIEFPEAWLVFDVTGDTDAQVDAVTAASDAMLLPDPAALREELGWRGARGQEMLAILPTFGMCALDMVPLPAATILDPDFLQTFETLIRAEDGIPALEGIERIDLSAGPAITYRWTVDDDVTDGLVTRHSGFLIGGDRDGAILMCQGSERPADGWLPIAESIEFLPVRV